MSSKIPFKTAFEGRERHVAPSGSRYKNEYEYEIDSYGRKVLKKQEKQISMHRFRKNWKKQRSKTFSEELPSETFPTSDQMESMQISLICLQT